LDSNEKIIEFGFPVISLSSGAAKRFPTRRIPVQSEKPFCRRGLVGVRWDVVTAEPAFERLSPLVQVEEMADVLLCDWKNATCVAFSFFEAPEVHLLK
jgi:hypothetical protein